jgi:hypothetical protein
MATLVLGFFLAIAAYWGGKLLWSIFESATTPLAKGFGGTVNDPSRVAQIRGQRKRRADLAKAAQTD